MRKLRPEHHTGCELLRRSLAVYGRLPPSNCGPRRLSSEEGYKFAPVRHTEVRASLIGFWRRNLIRIQLASIGSSYCRIANARTPSLERGIPLDRLAGKPLQLRSPLMALDPRGWFRRMRTVRSSALVSAMNRRHRSASVHERTPKRANTGIAARVDGSHRRK
jgi:hypothetical protein